MSLTRIVAALLPALMFAACSNTRLVPQEIWEAEQMQESMAYQQRIDAVGLPLLAAAVPHCRDEAISTTGVTFTNYLSFQPMDRKPARKVIGTEERLHAVWVVPGLAADRAGLRAGDVLLRIDGKSAPTGEMATEAWQAAISPALRRGDPIELVVLRGTEEIAARIEPTAICPYRMELWGNRLDVFARTTGREIAISAGLLRFARSDSELAVVLGHEIAHNITGHVQLPAIGDLADPVSNAAFDLLSEMTGAGTVGALSRRHDPKDGASSTAATAMEQELEADYVGLYLVAAAGMKVDGAEDVWRRLERINPDSTTDAEYRADPSHPTHAARLAAFQEWIPEIKRKQAAGDPLVPERHDWARWLRAHGWETVPPAPAAQPPGAPPL